MSAHFDAGACCYVLLFEDSGNRIRLRSTSSRWSWQSGWQRKQKRCPMGFRVFQTWSASAKSRSMQLVCHQIGCALGNSGLCIGDLEAKDNVKSMGTIFFPPRHQGHPLLLSKVGVAVKIVKDALTCKRRRIFDDHAWHVFFQCVRAWYASRVGKGKKCVSASAAAVPLVCARLAVHV